MYAPVVVLLSAPILVSTWPDPSSLLLRTKDNTVFEVDCHAVSCKLAFTSKERKGLHRSSEAKIRLASCIPEKDDERTLLRPS